MSVTFKNGNKYKGDLNRYWILNYKDEVIYEGNFVNNLFHGKGTLKWIKDNQEYTGTFKNNLHVKELQFAAVFSN